MTGQRHWLRARSACAVLALIGSVVAVLPVWAQGQINGGAPLPTVTAARPNFEMRIAPNPTSTQAPAAPSGPTANALVVQPLSANSLALQPLAQVSLPAELVELTRALKNDPDLIYEYVVNNIATLPQYGSLKGPLGTLLDGSGTNFDQAELMVTLLQQAGYTASYQTGKINLTVGQLTQWLGTDASGYSLGQVFGTGGFPTVTLYGTGMTNITSVDVPWIWVKATINGTAYVFNPSAKAYNRSTPIANLATALGYTQSTFLTRATTGDKLNTLSLSDISGLNRTNVRSDLTSFASNLVSYIRANSPAAAATDIIGGKTIVPIAVNTHQRITTLPNLSGTATDLASIGTAQRTRLTLTLPGASAVTFNSSDIYGHRLSLFFNTSNQPVLRLDGVVQSTGSAQTANTYMPITVAIAHGYNSTFADLASGNYLQVLTGGTYVISNGWGQVGRGVIEKHRKLLAQNQAALPGNSTDETILGESLSMLGFAWLAENARVEQVTDQFSNVSTVYHHAVGIVGMKTVGTGQGPYVDLPINALGPAQRIGRPNQSTPTPAESSTFFTDAAISSVLENGVIEQTQPGATAVSTVKLLDIVSQTGTIFNINDSTIAGDNATYYTNTIRPKLTGYAANDLSRIDSLVSSGMRVIAAQNGATTVNLWTGTGYFQVKQDGSAIGAIITGGLSGGEPATVVNPPALVSSALNTLATGAVSTVSSVIGAVQGGISAALGLAGDPVNRVTGDYIYSHDDLTVGSGAFPYGLGFQRSYDSGTRLKNGPLGLGWTHNFAITALADSDGFEGMAATSPVSGAAAIAAIYVVQDILNNANNAKPLDRMMIGVEAERWLMDQLTGNIVAVTQPGSGEHFTKLADGSYNPPIGSASSLSLSGGLYTYKTKDQVTLSFNSAGNLATWTHPSGPTVTLTYSGSNLTSVTNGMGRTLTLTYNTSSQISGVADGTGRSGSYTYDASGDLTGFKDAASNATTFAYDVPGRMTKVFYPSNPTIAFVTNTFDSLGRVSVQQDANSHTSNLYFAGTRTEIDDAAGTPSIFYFSPRGKLLTAIDGLGHQTVSAYDGLDRLTQLTLPEGVTGGGDYVTYAYDTRHNPITVTATPKTGSGLSARVQSFTYDATYNKVHTATDALSLTTTYTYDPATGNLTAIAQPAVGGQTPQQSFTYNARGQVLSATDPTGKVTQYAYDTTTEKLLTVTDDTGTGHLNLLTQFAYDSVGNVTSKTDPDGHAALTAYDALRRATQLTAPAPLSYVTTYAYDPDGRVLTVVNDPGAAPHLAQTTTATYSPSGKKLTETDPSSNKTTYTYDVLDRLATRTDAAGRVTSYGYDVLSRLASVSNTAIQATPLEQHSYTVDGKEASVTDANGHATSYAYDGFDRLAKTTYADASTEAYSYDANNNTLTRKTRSGNTVTLSYDALNRLSTKAPQGELTTSYAYDLAGRVTSVSDSNGAFTYGFDTARRVISVTRPDAKQVAYQYDAAGNRTRLTWPDSFYVTYSYDALNRITDVLQSGSSSLAHYAYDAASRRTALTYGNTAHAAYGYAPNNDLTSLTQSFVGSAVSLTYGYNKVHQRISNAPSDASYLYHPAAALSASYTPNAVNEYTVAAGATLSYDGNANLKTDGTYTYGYDTENRLLTVTATGHSFAYSYDPLSRRKQKTVDGVVTQYLLDGSQEIAE